MLTWIDKGSSRNIFIDMLFVFSLNNIYIYIHIYIIHIYRYTDIYKYRYIDIDIDRYSWIDR